MNRGREGGKRCRMIPLSGLDARMDGTAMTAGMQEDQV